MRQNQPGPSNPNAVKVVSAPPPTNQPLRVNPAIEAEQAEKLDRLRERRDAMAFGRAIDALKKAAEGTDNVLYPLQDALRADATLGEVCDALRDVWGEYQPGEL